jgi:hypothetical protein
MSFSFHKHLIGYILSRSSIPKEKNVNSLSDQLLLRNSKTHLIFPSTLMGGNLAPHAFWLLCLKLGRVCTGNWSVTQQGQVTLALIGIHNYLFLGWRRARPALQISEGSAVSCSCFCKETAFLIPEPYNRLQQK